MNAKKINMALRTWILSNHILDIFRYHDYKIGTLVTSWAWINLKTSVSLSALPEDTAWLVQVWDTKLQVFSSWPQTKKIKLTNTKPKWLQEIRSRSHINQNTDSLVLLSNTNGFINKTPNTESWPEKRTELMRPRREENIGGGRWGKRRRRMKLDD